MGENYSVLAREDRQFIIRKNCFLIRVYFFKQFWIHGKIEQKVEMLYINADFNIFWKLPTFIFPEKILNFQRSSDMRFLLSFYDYIFI